jgi:glycosyltransferase involved in cell wall biosynthesis
MRIAQLAPLWEQVPPSTYGGIELVVSLLTEELVRRGHDVTLFASGDSTTLAKLESVHPKALRLDSAITEYAIYDMLNMNRVFKQADRFDIIHSHVGCAAMPYSDLVKTPTIHTIHGIFTPDNEKMFAQIRHQPFVSISDAQREPKLGLNYVSTVYNGIDPTTYAFHPRADYPPYLAFLGRISPEKGTHLAIAIAQQSGWHLKIAGKIDPVDRAYFKQEIEPHLDGKQIEFLGEANHRQKSILMGGAVATLFPITWQEPFGLVMIESMVTGTPVIAINLGSVPEVIAHGKTGFLCDSVEDCVFALGQVASLDRRACRDHVLKNFTAKQMADGYEMTYQKILTEYHSQNDKNLVQLIGSPSNNSNMISNIRLSY